jgi:hypothetical protein
LGLDPDIFGAIWLEFGRIVIDESLDPEVRPEYEGATGSRSPMKAAGIGGCIGLWFVRPKDRVHS